MNAYTTGETLRGCTSGAVYTIEDHLGTGGQAEVYGVRAPDNKRLAAKLFHRDCSNAETLRNIDALIKQGKPSEHFVWFHETIRGESCQATGFVLDRVADDYIKPIDLLAGRYNPDFLTLTRFGLNIAMAVSHVHSSGRFFGDISHQNIFLHDKGRVLFIDSDNIVTNNTASDILGNLLYMPPELFPFSTPHLTSPNILTDRYSMGVLLYLLFMREHPTHGVRYLRECQIHDRKCDLSWYGRFGWFSLDPSPTNDNQPDPNIHKHVIANWQVLPASLQQMFTQTFVDGRLEPSSRPRISEWIKLFAELPNRLFKCHHSDCRADNFHNQLSAQLCWRCHRDTRPSAFLHFTNGETVCLSGGTQLFDHHLRPISHRYKFEQPQATVEAHPSNNSRGFRNQSDRVWYAIPSKGKPLAVPPDRVIAIQPRLRINFGTIEAEIRRNL